MERQPMAAALLDIRDDPSEPLAAPVNDELLARVVTRIVGLVPSACVVLFGSHAYGRPRGNSDLDLLVIADTPDNPLAVAGELYGRLRPRTIAMDLVVLTPRDVRRRLAGFDPFLEDVISLGRVLHGKLP